MKREDFIRILQENKDDYEQFSMIKDQMIFSGKSPDFQSKCLTCGLFSHDFMKCGLFHYIPDKEKILKKLEFSWNQERRTFKRKLLIKTKSLEIKKACFKKARMLMKNLLIPKQKLTESRLFDSEKSLAFSLEEPSSIQHSNSINGSNQSLHNLI